MALTRSSPLGQRVYYQDGQYLVSVRYPFQRHDIRSFVQPDNPDIQAIYAEIGPDYWALYDFVCREIDYRSDTGEFWLTPSETLRGYGDCEDTSLLLCSLLRCFSDAHIVLGSFQGYGHAWCQLNGQILETTFTSARIVPNSAKYFPYMLFDNEQVIELWPGALKEIFTVRRNEATKLSLMAEIVNDKT
ncbi:hypothetical protein ES703_112567 [subsurface metagenome]